MGKYNVIKGFIDKETGKSFEAGSIYECTGERYNVLKKRGCFLGAEIIEEKTKEPVKGK